MRLMNSRKMQSRAGEGEDESNWVGNVFVYFNFNNSMDLGTGPIVDTSGVSGGGEVTEVDGRPYSILVSTTGPEV